jgi:hypothetical protein
VLRWLEYFNIGHETIKKGIRLGRPSTARTSSAVQRVSRIITENRRVTIDELQLAASFCRETIHAIIRKNSRRFKDEECLYTLGSKRSQAGKKERRKHNCQQLLSLHSKDPEGFFVRLVAGDESWLHYQTPKVKSSVNRVVSQRENN